MNTTTCSRTLARLRRLGYTAQKVEQWIPRAFKRRDLFGVIDVVALKEGVQGVLGVQSSTGGDLAAHVRKALEEPRLRLWLETGNRFLVWGWVKKGKRGQRKTWQVNEREITLEDLNGRQ